MQKITLLFLLNFFLFSCHPSAKKERQDLKNVVFIVGDDHAYKMLGANGNPNIRTPNLDNLASEGMLFSNAYANAPLCSASRQSMLTGKYPHATGVTLLRTSFPDQNITMAEHLKQFGYQTALIGKDHFNNNLSHGFDTLIKRNDWRKQAGDKSVGIPNETAVLPTWKPFRDPAAIWLNASTLPAPYYDEDISGTFYANKAADFIEKNKDNKFFLWLAFHEPHSPFRFPIEDRDKYNSLDPDLPEMSPEDEPWMPAEFANLSPQQQKGIIKSYYTSVEHMDKNAGIVLDKIKALGLEENTLIVYLGDHGYLLADHGRFEKHMMWEEAIRAPLIIKAGKNNQANSTSSVLSEFVDLAPTVMDILQLENMLDSQGKSLWPVISGKNTAHKDRVFAEYLVDNKAMVTTKEWKYIYSTGKRDLGQGYATGNPPMGIKHRLYDLLNDPNETKDLGSEPNQEKRVREYQEFMIQWFLETHPLATELPKGLTTEETLAWFCVPRDEGAELEAQ